MTKPMISIHDCETNEIVEREMNDEEFSNYEEIRLANEERTATEIQRELSRAALLSKLGITADEAKLLLG